MVSYVIDQSGCCGLLEEYQTRTAQAIAAYPQRFPHLTPVTPAYARQWVLNGMDHTTELYVTDDGKVRRAKAVTATEEALTHG